jgi:hypothetical protein
VEDDAGTDDDQAAAVVGEYVDAISADDVDAAMALRCRAARPDARLMDQFAGEVERLEQAIGPIAGVETRPVTSRLQPLADEPDPVHVGYRLVVGGETTDEMIAVTVVEDGERRLCGNATAVSQTWAETLPSQLTPQPATSAELVDLMPAAGPPDSVQVEDLAVPVDEVVEPRPGLVACWTRAWQYRSWGGARVEAYRFDTEQHSTEAAQSLLASKSADGIGTFSVPGVPGGVGLRVMSSAWLLVQPPDAGPMFDSVTIVYGTTVVEIEVTDPGDGHEAVSELARSVSASAASG